MSTDVDVPKVGPVDKKVLAGVVVSVGGFVGYRYWHAKRMAAASAADTSVPDATASEFDNTNSDPSAVLGAVSPTNSYGDPGAVTNAPTSDTYGFHGTTNDQWTQYVATQLSQSDRWSYTDVVEALGLYLAQRPTTVLQQSIVTAAIAVGGNPPVGSHILINAAVPTTTSPVPTSNQLPGPHGLVAAKIERTSVLVRFTGVQNAAQYLVTYAGKTRYTHATFYTATSLKPGTHYTFTVQAVDAHGIKGQSATVSVTTTK